MVEVMVAFITGGFGLVGILIPILIKQNRAIKSVQEDSAAAREQVQNSHRSNLRDDLDMVMAGVHRIEQTLDNQATALNNMRIDLGWERRERMDLAHRVERLEP